ncbi:hypothetical protein HY413_00160 [Candidatus Kaiserbacteria bacterium]|nr:hypothetical protein [Candidatus Kaiserbacteria bacterium]
MGKRGPKPKKIFSTEWTPELAYAIGLLASDGCMTPYFHLIDLTSKDQEQLRNFSKCLGVPLKIGVKSNGDGKTAYRVQFKNALFYEFLFSIGLTPAKSKTIGSLKIPKRLFWDFLRGSYDGDGCSYAYWDPRWRSSFMFYTTFVSASHVHIKWLQSEIFKRLNILGHVTRDGRGITEQLKYAKADSLKILRKMYYSRKVVCLSRKRLKVEKFLGIVGERL